jgi:hypothetical protein
MLAKINAGKNDWVIDKLLEQVSFSGGAQVAASKLLGLRIGAFD